MRGAALIKTITDKPTATRGRKVKVPPKDCAASIEDLAANGYSQLGIAKHLQTSPDTLRRWFSENPELQNALDRGREDERWTLHNMLFRQATEKGNTTAAIFLLKSRHGYVDNDRSQIANKFAVNVNSDFLAELSKRLPN